MDIVQGLEEAARNAWDRCDSCAAEVNERAATEITRLRSRVGLLIEELRENNDENDSLRSLVERYEKALRRVGSYKWPQIKGSHTETFYGEATGAEYTLKHPVPKETALQALESVRAIARKALENTKEG